MRILLKKFISISFWQFLSPSAMPKTRKIWWANSEKNSKQTDTDREGATIGPLLRGKVTIKYKNITNNSLNDAKLSESKATKVALTYYVITEGEGGSLKGLCMIMGEGGELDFRWHQQISLFTKWNSFQISPIVLLKLIICFFISGFSLIYINVKNS